MKVSHWVMRVLARENKVGGLSLKRRVCIK